MTTPDLNPGTTKWFRVIAITNENDGEDTTGGSAVEVDTGNPAEPVSPEESTPNAPMEHDQQEALPEDGTTDSLGDAPADKDPGRAAEAG